MSWLRDERPRFAWLTNDGELILFDELHSEVRLALRRDGVDIDAWPLACALRAIRRVTEDLLERAALPTPEELCALVADDLRRERILLTEAVIRAVIAAFLDQLQRLDIARVHYF